MGFLAWFLKPLSTSQESSPKNAGDVREQALANMRAARERIGDDEIQKMAVTLREESMKVKAEKARKEILAADKVEVANHLKNILKDDL